VFLAEQKLSGYLWAEQRWEKPSNRASTRRTPRRSKSTAPVSTIKATGQRLRSHLTEIPQQPVARTIEIRM